MVEKASEKAQMENDTQHEKKSTGRTIVAIILVIFTVLLIGITAPSLWLKNVVLDENQWVAIVSPLSQSLEVQQAVSDKVSTKLDEIIDAEGLAKQYLPETAQPLAPFIATGVDSFVDKQVQNIVASPSFSSLWNTIVRESHPAVVTAITGTNSNGVISANTGTVTINLDSVVEKAKNELVDRGFSFLADKSIDAKLGTVEVFSSPALAQIQVAFNTLQGTAQITLVLVLVLGALTVIIAPKRLKAILWLGMGTFIIMLASVVAINSVQAPFIDSIPNLDGAGKAAVSSSYDIITESLLTVLKTVGIIGLIVGIIAFIAGIPSLKSRVKNLMGELSHNEKGEMVPFFRFIERYHNPAIILGFTVAGILILFLFRGSFELLMGIVIGLIIWLAIIGILVAIGRTKPEESYRQQKLDEAKESG